MLSGKIGVEFFLIVQADISVIEINCPPQNGDEASSEIILRFFFDFFLFLFGLEGFDDTYPVLSGDRRCPAVRMAVFKFPDYGFLIIVFLPARCPFGISVEVI